MSNTEVTVEAYAEALFQKERVLDKNNIVEKQVKKGFFKTKTETVLEGSVENAFSSLEAYARNHRVPFVQGDFEHTNRLPSLDQRILSDAATRAAFRKAYAATLARHLFQSSVHLPLAGPALAKAAEFERDEVAMNNPFVPLAQRTPGLIERLETQRAQIIQQTMKAVDSGQSDPDPVLFPGQRVERLSDMVKIQKDLQRTGDMAGALSRAGVDAATYGRLMIEWAQLVSSDPTLQAKYARMLAGGSTGGFSAN